MSTENDFEKKILSHEFENKISRLICAYIKENKKITKKNIIEDLGIPENKAKYFLRILRMNDKILKIGNGKNCFYIIKESEENKSE